MIIERAKGFLRKLNEETLALTRETPEGRQVMTFRQSLWPPNFRRENIERLPIKTPEATQIDQQDEKSTPP